MIDYICCIHNLECIDVRNTFSLNNSCIDHSLPYKYICGTKIVDDIYDKNIINSSINNIYSSLNKYLRQFTSLMYILENNVINEDYFLFMNCTSCLKNNINKEYLKYDFLYMKKYPPIYSNNEYCEYIKKTIYKLYNLYGNSLIDFYKFNFYDFDLFSNQNGNLPPYNICINKNNKFILQIFKDMLDPFLKNDNIKYFNSDLTRLLLNHLYNIKYFDKFTIYNCIDTVQLPRNTYEYMHYYGD